jgi:hypothetical protein
MGDVDKRSPFHCLTITRSWKARQVKSITSWDPTMVEYKNLSCFCVQCQDSGAVDLPCEQVLFYQFILLKVFLNVHVHCLLI